VSKPWFKIPERADGIGQSVHTCPIMDLIHLGSWNVIVDHIDADSLSDGELDELQRAIQTFLDIHTQAAFDLGFEKGMDHMAGKSDASRKERARAIEQRHKANGHHTGKTLYDMLGRVAPLVDMTEPVIRGRYRVEPLDDHTFEHGVLDDEGAPVIKEAA